MYKTKDKKFFLGVLGHPIGHSLSPELHAFLGKEFGIDLDYQKIDVAPCDLKKEIDTLKLNGVKGLNITIPHKIEIIKYLDEISEKAKILNSVNTVVNRNGKLYGYSTDGDGFYYSLLLNGCEIKNKNVLVIGAGGAARAVCLSLAENGAKSITNISRTQDKVHTICDMLEKYTDASVFDALSENMNYDFIINTTPVGMHPLENENSCKFMELINENTTCVDLIYNPGKTLFLREAEKKNAKIINGLGMLLMQGILSFQKFFDIEIDKDKAYDKLQEEFKDFRI